MKRIAVTGLSGVIGQQLLRFIPEEWRVIDLFRSSRTVSVKENLRIDLLSPDGLTDDLARVRPDFVLHMAAVTHIDRCESDKINGESGNVWKTNVTGTEVLARACGKLGIPMVFLSTECVFDGLNKSFAEDDRKNPVNWYGITKSEAEDRLTSTGCKSAIVRAVVAYHPEETGSTIYGKMLRSLRMAGSVSAVFDQEFTPTYTADIIEGLIRIIQGNLNGIFHIAPVHPLRPYDFALLIARKYGFSKNFVHKTTLTDLYGTKFASLRLKHASLDGRNSTEILRFVPKSPQEVIIG